jgi:hypothetical protein
VEPDQRVINHFMESWAAVNGGGRYAFAGPHRKTINRMLKVVDVDRLITAIDHLFSQPATQYWKHTVPYLEKHLDEFPTAAKAEHDFSREIDPATLCD